MILEQQDDRISGRYLTQIGHEEVTGRDHSIVGVANGATIGFVMAWPDAGSVTAWAGRIEAGADDNATLHTVWPLVRSVNGEPQRELGIWESSLTNSSVFRKSGGET